MQGARWTAFESAVYSGRVVRGVAASLACLIGLSSPALAGGLELDGLSARAIARAGTTTVSDDSGAALARNPAGLARRSTRRLQLGLSVHDVDVEYDATGARLPVDDRSAPGSVPLAALVQGWDRVVAGIAYLETADRRVVTNEPAFNQPADQVLERFPQRYAATALSIERRTLAAGVAVRATPWLAVGMSATASRVDWSEAKHVWVGFSGIDPDVGNPTRDLRLALDATDALVLGGHAGVLVVPESLPFEVAVALAYRGDARVSGDARLAATRDVEFPAVVTNASDASATLPSPLVLSTGARYITDRVALELGADVSIFTADELEPTWQFELSVQNQATLPPAAFTRAGSAVALRDHYTARAAVDVEVVRDLLWLVGGYSFTRRATPRSRLNSGFAELATHTIAVGAEAYWRDLTISAGYARGLSSAFSVASDRTLVNPLDGGTRTVGSGTYDRTADAFGLSLEIAWDDAPAL